MEEVQEPDTDTRLVQVKEPLASKNHRPLGEINGNRRPYAAAQADIAEYQQAIQGIADLKNQLATAALQHGNDQQLLANLVKQVSDLKVTLDTDEMEIADLKEQYAQLQSTVTYPDLEWAQFALNLKPDAASGRGDATFPPADTGKPSVFSIVPAAPLAGQTDNYFNVYATRKFKPNAAYRNFTLSGQWDFPTDADMKAAHCIEMEVRQVLKITTGDTLPLMAVPACQLNFSGNMFRYFNALAPGDNWIPTGIPMPRQRTVAVVMEAHRDEKTLFYDAFTINGQRHAVSFQAPLYAKTYVNERLSCELAT
jgi:hypothetical protein